jgi:hypothetical protein
MASGATTGATRGGVTAGRIVAVTGLTGLTGLTGRIGRIGRIVVGTVVLVAGRNVKGSGVARC